MHVRGRSLKSSSRAKARLGNYIIFNEQVCEALGTCAHIREDIAVE
jgi:hypothetical protein